MLGRSAVAFIGSGPSVHAEFKLPIFTFGAAGSGTRTGV